MASDVVFADIDSVQTKPDGFYLLEDGIFRADYDLEQGKFSESIVAGTTCGELPFFSDTPRTATVVAEKRAIAWILDEEHWNRLQKEHQEVAYELMKICLKLTSERLSAITRYVELLVEIKCIYRTLTMCEVTF